MLNPNRSLFAVYQFYERKCCSNVKSFTSIIELETSGGPLELGLRRVVRDVAIGSLLIQSDLKTGQPILLHGLLPISVRHRHLAEETWVFVLDAQVGLFYPCRTIWSLNVCRSRQVLPHSWPSVFYSITACRRIIL